jgi:NTP pyrophosphatase (non-canonical NTP hydrolase)
VTAGDYSIGSENWPGLGKVIEECGEVIQEAAKLIAVGGEDMPHWDGKGTTVGRLEDELGDARAAIAFLLEFNPLLDQQRIADRVMTKLALFRRWHAENADYSAGRARAGGKDQETGP